MPERETIEYLFRVYRAIGVLEGDGNRDVTNQREDCEQRLHAVLDDLFGKPDKDIYDVAAADLISEFS